MSQIQTIILFGNGMVMVFDSKGQQRSEHQGQWIDVKDRLAQKFPDANYNYASDLRSRWYSLSVDKFLKFFENEESN